MYVKIRIDIIHQTIEIIVVSPKIKKLDNIKSMSAKVQAIPLSQGFSTTFIYRIDKSKIDSSYHFSYNIILWIFFI